MPKGVYKRKKKNGNTVVGFVAPATLPGDEIYTRENLIAQMHALKDERAQLQGEVRRLEQLIVQLVEKLL